ncbi:MAG: hypothetical protein KGJ58_00730 [Patescibacteria group bacterium]|nr:hypothetical protein [Patescibacteria group bacterium]MDE2217968.1 hypothetical protein [Patescibacteria group bacterium]
MESNGVKYLFLTMIVAVASFFIIPNFSFAISEEEKTQALIDFFQNHLVQLRNETKDSNQWCYDFENNLNMGDENNDVYNLQIALQKDGFDTGITETNEQEPTVYFDEKLASLVSGFQMKYKDEILIPNNLQYGNGFVGQATRDKLNKLYGCWKDITPSITLLSPNGGEKLAIGQTYTIKWSSQNIPSGKLITISVYNPAKNDRRNMIERVVNNGEIRWTVPTVLDAGEKYYLMVEVGCDSGGRNCIASDKSDEPFSAVSVSSGNSPSSSAASDWQTYFMKFLKSFNFAK